MLAAGLVDEVRAERPPLVPELPDPLHARRAGERPDVDVLRLAGHVGPDLALELANFLQGLWTSKLRDALLFLGTPRRAVFPGAHQRGAGNLVPGDGYGSGSGKRAAFETDAGTQTRLFHFAAAETAAGEPTWQGYSVAQWEFAAGGGRGQPRTGDLKVVTTNLRPGYVRKNGAPYSAKTTVTEYYDLNTMPNGDRWFTVTTKVDDPVYARGPYLTTTDFKKLPDQSGWNPTPCSAR